MEQIASLRSCLDNDGNFDPIKFAQYRNQRCQYFDEDEEEKIEKVVVPKKRNNIENRISYNNFIDRISFIEGKTQTKTQTIS